MAITAPEGYISLADWAAKNKVARDNAYSWMHRMLIAHTRRGNKWFIKADAPVPQLSPQAKVVKKSKPVKETTKFVSHVAVDQITSRHAPIRNPFDNHNVHIFPSDCDESCKERRFYGEE